jgi:hypothetical protein
MNPDSFSQTVENLFYLAFLVKDGKVALDMDEETGEPMLSKWLVKIIPNRNCVRYRKYTS